jgi:ribose transport system permease protein
MRDTLLGAVRTFVRQGRLASLTVWVLLLIAIGINAWLAPNFFTGYSIRSNFATFVPLVAAAIGQTIIVLGAGIDLSLGALITLSSVVGVVLMDGDPANLPVAALAALAVGAVGGFVNGSLAAYLRLQPIVATFATSFVWAGLTLQVLPQPGGSVPTVMTAFYRDAVLGVPVAALVILALAGLWLAVKRHRLGLHIYAIGGDEQAAFASGINVNRVRVSSYVLGGLFGGLSALAILANTGSGDPYVGASAGAVFIGGELTLTSIAALVIGGTALSGGVGGAGGAIAGAIVLGLISNIVFFAGLSGGMRELIDGAIVIGALALANIPALRRARS